MITAGLVFAGLAGVLPSWLPAEVVESIDVTLVGGWKLTRVE